MVIDLKRVKSYDSVKIDVLACIKNAKKGIGKPIPWCKVLL